MYFRTPNESDDHPYPSLPWVSSRLDREGSEDPSPGPWRRPEGDSEVRRCTWDSTKVVFSGL